MAKVRTVKLVATSNDLFEQTVNSTLAALIQDGHTINNISFSVGLNLSATYNEKAWSYMCFAFIDISK